MEDRSPRRLKRILLGASLAGFGYGCVQAAPRAENTAMIALLSIGGLIALIVGIRTIWINRKSQKYPTAKHDEG